ncbi:MAG: metalloregulator ArsR/SmtB family transcription factor, partial [Clostridia bacterium]|nr:metalloregulator ArsR/SmtB family transcription factor [Clostridia bacterium]
MADTSALAVFKALGDESRLAILRILLAEDSYVELLASRLGLTSATVSFHLKKLESAGLVTCSRTQFYRIYSANREVFGATLASLVGTVPQPDDDTRYREEVLAAFFENGKLSKMPSQRKKREIVLRHLLRFLDPGREYGEKELDALLEEVSVPDYCFVRREMIAFGMLARRKNPDGGADLYRVTDGDTGKGT